ncbi:M20 family metallopeptidase [Candidatus Cetobacterium colombiensis]|uniref:Peptidase M20 domain-containing protein 2 n=1 Tax=Candidatus Cetobacterium colombiensis TaxID=3073100 RepID=A0ABU4WAX1_9FUSO|nr:M20 family metallopeptidase [Candidatus Cetobacterium colombiensis]MDX8336172.1 M20 family metallopeptidase [Candidatus Cetobacterium colombiensis]
MENRIINFLDKNRGEFIEISQKIHQNPEIGNEEYFAAELLTNFLEGKGFSIEKNIAGHETGFIARKKSAHGEFPKIAFLAEYDALPNLGHACGHNVIGAISAAGAVALGEALDNLPGEVVLYGCPSEEGGENGSAKGSFVRENLFENIDVAMIIHPSSENSITKKSLAVNPLDFEFFGKSSHAAGSPENGKNALDALLHFFNGIATLRQHVTSDVKIHGIITHGGDAPNIIPDYTKARFYIRAATKEGCDEVTQKIENIAQGAAIMTGCTTKISSFQNRVDNLVPTKYFDELYVKTMKNLGVDVCTNSKKGMGSTDVGNVSHIIPTIHPNIKICDSDVTGHTHEFAHAAGSSKGDEAVILGGKALALLGLELILDEEKLKKVKENFKK